MSYIEDRTNADDNIKKLVKCKPSKLQTRKRQVFNSSSDSEEKIIASLSDGK
jgi:hypothetical protein